MARRIGIGDLHTPEQIAAMSPEWARAVVDLLIVLNGGEIDERPIHPVTAERLDYPLTNEQCAAINHATLANGSDYGRQALLELDCDCDFCRHWRETRK